MTAAGARVAVVSRSRNAPSVLAAAGIADRFEVVVDGAVAAAEGLAGKPSPATYSSTRAQLLGVPTTAAIVIEDATRVCRRERPATSGSSSGSTAESGRTS